MVDPTGVADPSLPWILVKFISIITAKIDKLILTVLEILDKL